MFRRQIMAMMVAMLTLFPLTAYADARVTAAGALVDTMISDLETFLATDTGEESARTAEIDRVLNTYFDMDSICLLYTSPSPRDRQKSRMPSSA